MTGPDHEQQAERWRRFVERVRQQPGIPFAEQWSCFNEIFADRDPTLPPPPAWTPDSERLDYANIAKVMNDLGMREYAEFQRWTADNRAEFWNLVLERLGIVFSRRPCST